MVWFWISLGIIFSLLRIITIQEVIKRSDLRISGEETRKKTFWVSFLLNSLFSFLLVGSVILSILSVIESSKRYENKKIVLEIQNDLLRLEEDINETKGNLLSFKEHKSQQYFPDYYSKTYSYYETRVNGLESEYNSLLKKHNELKDNINWKTFLILFIISLLISIFLLILYTIEDVSITAWVGGYFKEKYRIENILKEYENNFNNVINYKL